MNEAILRQFLRRVGEGGWTWRLMGTEIRTSLPGKPGHIGCPLSVLYPDGPRPCRYTAAIDAGEAMGMNRAEARKILSAADGRADADLDLRQRLLEATGLAETGSTK